MLIIGQLSPRNIVNRVSILLVATGLLAVTLVLLPHFAPMLVARTGMQANVADAIVRVVTAIGSFPWWAVGLVAGIAIGVLLRFVARYGIRWAVAW